jgi:hypothetical protein
MKVGYLFQMGHEWQFIPIQEQQYYINIFVCKCMLMMFIYEQKSYEVAISLYRKKLL